MDTLYIGDIPLDYHYAQFNSNSIRLYNKPSFQYETANYYQIYTTYNGFYYTTGTQSFGSNVSYFQDIKVSNDWLYRSDIDKIFIVSFIIIFMFIFIFNIITSCFKKGGVFGGLL